jgi:hypothetical protein
MAAMQQPEPKPSSGIRRISIKDIRLDSIYQRDLDSHRIRRMVEGWDERMAGVIAVSNRAGILWCVDGQHRLAAMRELGLLYCNATIFEGLAQHEEAALFVELNRNRKTPNAWDLFKAETAALHEDVLNIVRVVHSLGFMVGRVTNHSTISAIAALRRIYRLGSEPLLVATLRSVRGAWTGRELALGGQVLEGLALFHHSFRMEPQWDAERLVRVMERNTPLKLIADTQEIAAKRAVSGRSAVFMAEAIRDVYNTGLKREKKLGAVKRFRQSPSSSRSRTA